MMAAALGRWARTEMELPPHAAPSPAVLRRLCSGPGAEVWDFIIHHVRSPRNVKKIRGNLLWYQKELEAAAGPPSRQGALRAEVSRMRAEVRRLGRALGGAEEAALALEESLGAGQRRWWAELCRGAELRLLGAEPAPKELRDLQGALRAPPDRPHPSRAELVASLVTGAEPEVLSSIRRLCQSKGGEDFLEPRPPAGEPQETHRDWQEKAEAELSRHPPGAVLWALEVLANQSARQLMTSPAPSAEATPTVGQLIQECWGSVGGVWGSLPPLISRLEQLRKSLNGVLPKLGGDPKTRLALARAWLEGFWGSLTRGLQELRGGLGDPQNPPLGELRRRLRRGRGRVLQRQRRLRLLRAATRGRQARLRLLQGQVRWAAGAGPGSATPLLEGEGQRRRQLGEGRAGLATPLPPPGHAPLEDIGRGLGLAAHQPLPLLLRRVAELRQELRGAGPRQKGAGPRQKGAGPPSEKGACPSAPGPAPSPAPEVLRELRLVSAECRERIQGWPRLLQLLSQWWDLPAQHIEATPPGRAPLSHWLQRWRGAVLALATPTDQEGAGPAKPRP